MDQVLAALHDLYFSTSDTLRRNADKNLEQFQLTIDAWNVASQILSNPSVGLEPQIFAAQTLRKKIVYDLSQLGKSAVQNLKKTILDLFSKLSPTVSKNLLTQLSIALIYLAIQVERDEWPDPIGEILQLYSDGQLQQRSLLEYLTVFPEECKHLRISIASAKEDQIKQLMGDYVDKVMLFLFCIGNQQGWNNSLLSCVINWFKYGVRREEDCIRVISSFPIIDLAFIGLQMEDAIGICGEIIGEIVFKTATLSIATDSLATSTTVNSPSSLPLPYYILEKLLSPAISIILSKAVEEEEEEKIVSLLEIYNEIQWSYEDILLDRHDILLHVVDAVLIISTKTQSLEVFEKTLNFWEGLASLLDKQKSLITNSDLQDRLVKFLGAIIKISTLSADLHPSSTSTGSKEFIGDFRKFRATVADIFLIYRDVLNYPMTMGFLWSSISRINLFTCYNTKSSVFVANFNTLESLLYFVKSIGKKSDPSDSVMFPQLLNFLHQLQAKLCEIDPQNYRDILVIKRYHLWIISKFTNWFLSNASTYLEREVGFVVECLSDVQLQMEAINTFKELFLQCKGVFQSPGVSNAEINVCGITVIKKIDFIQQLVFLLRTKARELSSSEQVEVCSTISILLSGISYVQSKNFYVELFYEQLIDDARFIGEGGDAQPGEVADAFEKIALFIKNSAFPFRGIDSASVGDGDNDSDSDASSLHILIQLILKEWERLTQIADKFGSNINTMESFARFLKYSVIYCGREQYMEKSLLYLKILSLSFSHFKLFGLSWPIYLLRTFVREILVLDSPQLSSHVKEETVRILNGICSHLFTYLTNEHEILNADIIVDFFKLQISSFPLVIMQSQSNNQHQHNSHIGALLSGDSCSFVVELGLDCINRFNYGEVNESVIDYIGMLVNQRANSILQAYDFRIYYSLLKGLLIRFPSSYSCQISEILQYLHSLNQSLSSCILQQLLLEELPQTQFTPDEKDAFLHKYLAAISPCKHRPGYKQPPLVERIINLDHYQTPDNDDEGESFEAFLYSFTKTCHRRLPLSHS